MSESAVVNLSVDQGADFSLQMYWTDAGNNPFTVLHPIRMDIRSTTGQVVYAMASEAAETEEQPDILYNSDSGLIQLGIPATVTNGFAPGNYEYDLFVTYADESTGTTRVARLLRGGIYVHRRVTQL